eukprot:CAMPEP_0174373300 /NCGR_PEP_ID=MMETSP0811_2-20130205/106569_1 /TAXON_ID=73025 ORGANISM="Eutreptiella gymnastica-like, Strain CCMP1594" /NCGR_SAMPLE_ID=MMETSP0811_2 /ASSEMBLY_ACC=CAM_ASM_000667 /LENGTH=61 /DNA_ID=CAMNT_0015521469 /DNA_START=184 /DNA_END=369 /DNA_ORIENTATION=-
MRCVGIARWAACGFVEILRGSVHSDYVQIRMASAFLFSTLTTQPGTKRLVSEPTVPGHPGI